jgi:hypothetical protein
LSFGRCRVLAKMAKIENSRRGQAVRLYLLLVTSQKDTAAILNANVLYSTDARVSDSSGILLCSITEQKIKRIARAAGNAQQNPNWNDILMI